MTCMFLLASASPRRRELMELTGWDVEICPVPVDETVQIDERAEALAVRLARAKARAAAVECPACELVLAADTVVVSCMLPDVQSSCITFPQAYGSHSPLMI